MSEPAQPQHPEGLPFQPVGPGFTKPDEIRSYGPIRSLLLSEHNVESIRRNNENEFGTAMFALKQIAPLAKRDPRTGLVRRGFTDQELERIVALSVLVTKGVVPTDAPPVATTDPQ